MKNSATSHAANRELAARYLARKNFLDYNHYVCPEGEEPAPHHELMCDVGQQVIDGKIKRLMVFLPPGSAKSTYYTVRLPAYYMSVKERKGVITSSYADTLANSFGRKTRNLVNSPEHRALFDIELMADSKARGEWESTNGCYYYSCGVGGSVTGRRGDLGVIDDPVRSRQDADSETVRESTYQWYLSDFKTRLKPDAAIILIMTRWHEDDLAGRILPEDYAGESGWIDCRDGQQWYVINIPAEARENDLLDREPGEWLWPEWFTPSFWEALKSEQTTRNWYSLYQQVPAADDGSFYKREYFTRRWSVLPKNLEYYIGADFALTEDGGDYTEIGVFGVDPSRNIYVVDWFSGQCTPKTWKRELFHFAKKYKINWMAAEPGQIRRATEEAIRDEMLEQSVFFSLQWIGGGNSKEANAGSFKALCEAGRVIWPGVGHGMKEGHKALCATTDRVIEQLIKAFGGRYDDAIDATSCFGLEITKAWAARKPKPQPDNKPKATGKQIVLKPNYKGRQTKRW